MPSGLCVSIYHGRKKACTPVVWTKPVRNSEDILAGMPQTPESTSVAPWENIFFCKFCQDVPNPSSGHPAISKLFCWFGGRCMTTTIPVLKQRLFALGQRTYFLSFVHLQATNKNAKPHTDTNLVNVKHQQPLKFPHKQKLSLPFLFRAKRVFSAKEEMLGDFVCPEAKQWKQSRLTRTWLERNRAVWTNLLLMGAASQ